MPPSREGARAARSVVLALLAAAIGAFSGCALREDPDAAARFDALHALAGANRCEEALPLVKRFVQDYPEDAAGHYLLSVCYLRVRQANFTHAEGELDTALWLLRNRENWGVLQGRMPPDEFEALIRLAMIDVDRLWVGRAAEMRVPLPALRARLDKAVANTRRGEALNPKEGRFRQFREDFERLRAELDRAAPGLQ
jgi:tetratricopeptide (TPR) repeat protein